MKTWLIITTSNIIYDQRLRKVQSTIRRLHWKVVVWDRGRSRSIPHRFLSGIFFYLEWNLRLAFRLFTYQPRYLYLADIDNVPGVRLYKWFFPKTIVLLDLHELFSELPELHKAKWKQFLWRRIEKIGFGLADEVLTVNSSLQQIFESRYGRKPWVVANYPKGNPIPSFDLSHRLEQKILYYQGALNVGRGLEQSIEALTYLPEWRLWLVGGGDVEVQLRALAQKLNVDDRVHFWGQQKPEQLPALAIQGTLGLNVLAGYSDNYYYSLANKFCDYMQVGLPSINMAYPEYLEKIKEFQTGITLSELSSQAILAAVKELTDDVSKYGFYVDQSLQAAKVFTWESQTHILEKLITKYNSIERIG